MCVMCCYLFAICAAAIELWKILIVWRKIFVEYYFDAIFVTLLKLDVKLFLYLLWLLLLLLLWWIAAIAMWSFVPIFMCCYHLLVIIITLWFIVVKHLHLSLLSVHLKPFYFVDHQPHYYPKDPQNLFVIKLLFSFDKGRKLGTSFSKKVEYVRIRDQDYVRLDD